MAEVSNNRKVCWPTYLNCPYCPAQAFPVMVRRERGTDRELRGYGHGNSQHIFFVAPDRSAEERVVDVDATSKAA